MISGKQVGVVETNSRKNPRLSLIECHGQDAKLWRGEYSDTVAAIAVMTEQLPK